MAFIIIGAVGFVWMGFWIYYYDQPAKNKRVNAAELEYIEQDKYEQDAVNTDEKKKISFLKCFTYKQTWSFAFGKFMTDGVWWFFLFWMPLYIKAQFNIKTTDPTGQLLIFTMYAIITVLSIYGETLYWCHPRYINTCISNAIGTDL